MINNFIKIVIIDWLINFNNCFGLAELNVFSPFLLTKQQEVKKVENRFKMFTVLNSKINRCIRRIKTEEMAEFDLRSTHVSCLYYLYAENTLTAKELCDICDEDKAAISRSLE